MLPTSYRVRDLEIRPALVLAPMEGVTDLPFRRTLREALHETDGVQPGLVYSEFLASKGIARGDRRVWEVAAFDPDELPIALQIYGREPDLMAEAARLLEAKGASIIDINMGCPARKVVCHSGGSALMREPELAIAVVRAVRAAISIPLTVKMRSGFGPDERNAPELARAFESEGVEALTVHWRTRADGYGGTRDVDTVAATVAAVKIPVLGNGDIVDVASARAMVAETGCAGVMVGRGALADPWCFDAIGAEMLGRAPVAVSLAARERLLQRYLHHLDSQFRHDGRALGKLKQLFKLYAGSLPEGFAPGLRDRVLRAATREEAEEQLRAAFAEGGPGATATAPVQALAAG